MREASISSRVSAIRLLVAKVQRSGRRPRTLRVSVSKLVAIALVCCAPLSQSAAQTLDQLIEAAKREAKVVVLGQPDPQVRLDVPAAFKARYGITVEYRGQRGGESAAKLRAERAAGLYTADVILAGPQTMATVLHKEKMLDPIKPILVMPEVLDGSKWKSGKPWFMDPEQQYILRLFNGVESVMGINTSSVAAGELKSFRDLLDPKWKGKISIKDPTVTGSGANQAVRFYLQFGADFFKRLYIDQKPMISRDQRQLTDWLLRGVAPISLNADDDELTKMRKEGFPVQMIYAMPGLTGTLSAGVGQVAMLKNAPHPNAAKLFVNWIASKEGLETYAKSVGYATTRNDINESAFVAPEMIPRSGVEYFDTYEWSFVMTTQEETRLKIKELMSKHQ